MTIIVYIQQFVIHEWTQRRYSRYGDNFDDDIDEDDPLIIILRDSSDDVCRKTDQHFCTSLPAPGLNPKWRLIPSSLFQPLF